MRTSLLFLLLAGFQGVVTNPSQFIDRSIKGEVVREIRNFQIYAENAFVPVDLDWLQTELETIHNYLVDRMRFPTIRYVRPPAKIAVTFRLPETAPCPIRGLALLERRHEVIIFADAQTRRAQVSGVLAHEVAHILHARSLFGGPTQDFNLAEGLASWAAGRYWEAWQGTPQENVRMSLRGGLYAPLEERSSEGASERNTANCLRSRDLRYNSWAAFIDFLITNYGMNKFRVLLNGDPAARGTAPVTNFKAVYGLTLGGLEKAWLDKL